MTDNTCMALTAGVQEVKYCCGLLSTWNIGSCDQSGEYYVINKISNISY